jgi:anhydro-N-acetylmuramic acid kinase
VLAFDTGPANVLLDLALRHFTEERQTFDRGGAWAARGVVCQSLLAQWLSHPFLRRRPPKSTGRELFGESFFKAALREMRSLRLSKYDLAATLTAFTARSLVTNYQRHLPALPEGVVLSGGGAANPAMVRQIRESLAQLDPAVEVMTSDELGWPRQSIEPAAFALLAWLRWNKQPGNLPDTTGAQRPVLCGQITEV